MYIYTVVAIQTKKQLNSIGTLPSFYPLAFLHCKDNVQVKYKCHTSFCGYGRHFDTRLIGLLCDVTTICFAHNYRSTNHEGVSSGILKSRCTCSGENKLIVVV